ncbi:hypothetical protein BGW38_009880, partial [Lunasporangiospora selenospora]
MTTVYPQHWPATTTETPSDALYHASQATADQKPGESMQSYPLPPSSHLQPGEQYKPLDRTASSTSSSSSSSLLYNPHPYQLPTTPQQQQIQLQQPSQQHHFVPTETQSYQLEQRALEAEPYMAYLPGFRRQSTFGRETRDAVLGIKTAKKAVKAPCEVMMRKRSLKYMNL